ncbi:MAG TPA: PAS domain-containing protein [Azospirillaceae bacterium]|nr:PAS domain-containing protein [Azospirillaceae bacterium]
MIGPTMSHAQHDTDLLRAIADTTDNIVFAKDLSGRYLMMNAAGARLFDRPEADFIGRTDADLFPEHTARALRENDAKVIGSNASMKFEETAPGGERTFLTTKSPLRDAKGRVIGVVGVSAEITERLRIERELREKAALLEAVIQTTPECIKIVGRDGRLLSINPAGAAMVGAGCPEVLRGRSIFDVIAPEHRAAWIASHERICGGTMLTWQFDLIDTRGERHHMETTAVPLDLPDGERAHLGITRDVTARTRMESARLLLAREIDHRAKNTLAIVLSILRLTQARSVSEFVEAVEGRVTTMARTHRLLASRKWEGSDFKDVALEELSGFHEAGRIRFDGLGVRLHSDAVQPVALVLHELATNAVKHGALSVEGGSVSLSWRLDREADRLRIEWREAGGPRVAPPTRQGFGSLLVGQVIGHQLGGEHEMDWREPGLVARLTIPVEFCEGAGSTADQADGRAVPADLAAARN